MRNNPIATITQVSDKKWVAFATDERGNVLTQLEFEQCYLLGHQCFVVDKYLIAPDSFSGKTFDEARTLSLAAGNALDLAIAKLAACLGVSSVLLIQSQELRTFMNDGSAPIFERKVLTGSGGVKLSLPALNEKTPPQATEYVN